MRQPAIGSGVGIQGMCDENKEILNGNEEKTNEEIANGNGSEKGSENENENENEAHPQCHGRRSHSSRRSPHRELTSSHRHRRSSRSRSRSRSRSHSPGRSPGRSRSRSREKHTFRGPLRNAVPDEHSFYTTTGRRVTLSPRVLKVRAGHTACGKKAVGRVFVNVAE